MAVYIQCPNTLVMQQPFVQSKPRTQQISGLIPFMHVQLFFKQ